MLSLQNIPCICLLLVLAVVGNTLSAEVSSCSTIPTLEHGQYEERGVPISTIHYSCNGGYILQGLVELNCINGTWWPDQPTCVPETVPRSCKTSPVVSNGHVEFVTTEHRISISKSVARVTCNPGFSTLTSFKDEYLIMCGANGHWSRLIDGGELMRCASKRCHKPPNIPFAKYRLRPLFPHGVQVTYMCLPVYKLLNPTDSKLTCSYGEWVGAIPTCEHNAFCMHPEYVADGRWNIIGLDGTEQMSTNQLDSSVFRVGTVIKYVCDKGFKIIGPDELLCRSSEIWSKIPPTCIPESEHSWFCPDIQKIKNGFCKCENEEMADLDRCKPFRRGTHIECDCLEGYIRVGADVLTCTHMPDPNIGVWDWEVPWCRKRYPPASDMDVLPDGNSGTDTSYNSGDISDGKNKVSSLVIVITTACSVFGVLLFIMVVVIFRKKKPRAPLFQQGPTPPPYARVHNNSMDEHDRLALMAYAEASRTHLPTYEEAMRPGRGNPAGSSAAMIGPGGFTQHPPTNPAEYNRFPAIHPAVRAANLQLQQAMAGDGNNNINNNNNNNSNSNRHSTVTASNISEMFGSVDTVNVSMSDASTCVTVETFDSGTSNRSMSSQQARAGSLHSSDDQLATDDAPLLDSSSQREVDVVSMCSNPSRTSKDE